MIDPRFEVVLAEGGGAFRCIHRRCEDLAADHGWHFHPEYELTWMMRGAGDRYVGDHLGHYEPDDLVLAGPSLPHCWRNVAGPAEWISAQFMPDCLGQGFLELPEAEGIRRLVAESAGGLAFAAETTRAAAPLLREMARLSGMSQLLRLAEVLDLLSRAPSRRLASADFGCGVVVDQAFVQRIERIHRYIADRFRGAVSQAEVAAELGLSAAAFSKFVRAVTGRTFMSMVKQRRINEACRLLANSSVTITDVALDCGYQHTSHFDRQFLEVKGVSPSEYRRRVESLRQLEG